MPVFWLERDTGVLRPGVEEVMVESGLCSASCHPGCLPAPAASSSARRGTHRAGLGGAPHGWGPPRPAGPRTKHRTHHHIPVVERDPVMSWAGCCPHGRPSAGRQLAPPERCQARALSSQQSAAAVLSATRVKSAALFPRQEPWCCGV